MGRQGNQISLSPYLLISLSPYLLVSLSPCPSVPLSFPLIRLRPITDGLKVPAEISSSLSHDSRVFNSMNVASLGRRARS
jgi:hypothetical protein